MTDQMKDEWETTHKYGDYVILRYIALIEGVQITLPGVPGQSKYYDPTLRPWYIN